LTYPTAFSDKLRLNLVSTAQKKEKQRDRQRKGKVKR
jgi:hypothetical protein